MSPSSREPLPSDGRLDPAGLRRVPSRADRVRRALVIAVMVGVLLLVAGIMVGLAAAGPSVPATVLVIAGLLTSCASLVAHRLVFWAQVVAEDRAGKPQGPGP